MTNGIKRNEDGTFTVSEAWLTNALTEAVEKGMYDNDCCSMCTAEEIMKSITEENK
jgi:hypothetical protein